MVTEFITALSMLFSASKETGPYIALNRAGACDGILQGRELDGNDEWEVDGKPYEATMGGLLDDRGGSFKSLFALRKAAGLQNKVMDLFGSGFNIENEPNVDAMLGVRLGFSQQTPKAYERRREIHGNLFTEQGWREIDLYKARNNIESFSVIILRPIWGFVHDERHGSLEDYWRTAWALTQRAYAHLSPDQGEFYLELWTRGERLDPTLFVDCISANSGIGVFIPQSNRPRRFLLRIEKHSTSPKFLSCPQFP